MGNKKISLNQTSHTNSHADTVQNTSPHRLQKNQGPDAKTSTKTVCTCRDRNLHTHSFRRIYKAAHMPGSVL